MESNHHYKDRSVLEPITYRCCPFEANVSNVRKGKGRFCSLSCSSSRVRKSHTPNCECATCGQKMYKRPSVLAVSKSRLFFCSNACRGLAQSFDSDIDFRPSHYKRGEHRRYRDIAFTHFEHKCNRCGFCQFEDILQVHHKDHDHKNNQPDNLEILCPNCHATEHRLNGAT